MKTKTEIQEECLTRILPMKRSGISLVMGTGKTLLGLRHMDALYKQGKKQFLVVAPKKSIFRSWGEDAVKFDLRHLIPLMKFTTYLSLKKLSHCYDAVYLDEAHSLIQESHDGWLSKYDGVILGLSGTWPKWENSEKGQMVEKYCPLMYEYEVDEAVGDKILNDYRITVHQLELSHIKNLRKESRAGRSWVTSERADYEYWTGQIEKSITGKQEQLARIMRMKALMGYQTKELYAKKLFGSIQDKCILFANTQKQADKLSSFSYHSTNPKSEDNLMLFKTGHTTKLSCVLQLNEGVNIPGLKAGIIMHAYGNERKASQRIGRLLRLNPDETAEAHVLCYMKTVDESWVKKALEDYDQTKISWK